MKKILASLMMFALLASTDLSALKHGRSKGGDHKHHAEHGMKKRRGGPKPLGGFYKSKAEELGRWITGRNGFDGRAKRDDLLNSNAEFMVLKDEVSKLKAHFESAAASIKSDSKAE